MRTSIVALALLFVGCGDGGDVADADREIDAARVVDAPTEPLDAGPCVPGTASTPEEVATSFGVFRGETSGSTHVFRGIPYAAPPIAALRFREPAPPLCSSTVRDATEFGPVCPQLADGMPIGDEDCLSLNVWTPTSRGSEPLPVLFFIHGGGNNQGSGSEAIMGMPIYDGRALAERGAIVVTMNYRLGALGFLAHAGLDAERAESTSGNWALRDQVAALRWVRDEIDAFGGDPSRVMIFGESAGGLNVCMLLASPLASGLFSSALIESGGCPGAARSTALDAADRLIAGADCDGEADPIACLRSKSASEILRALPQDVTGITNNDFSAFVDGTVVPRAPMLAFAAGEHNAVPIILGTNSEETGRMVPPASMFATEAQYEAWARLYLSQYGLSGATADAVIDVYPTSDYPSIRGAAVALSTDTRWTCPARAILTALAMGQSEPVRRYFFTQRLNGPLAALGATHALELPYVFGVLRIGGYVPTPADEALSSAMGDAWTSFGTSGTPGDVGGVTWPAWTEANDDYLELGTPIRASEGVRRAQCDAIEAALGR
ncbi:MAG: carboxylesterase family protein [Deltaproteobacteria bacterium]|nr:carboxylesterase family protein [Deltaproteobacteria bacterium]